MFVGGLQLNFPPPPGSKVRTTGMKGQGLFQMDEDGLNKIIAKHATGKDIKQQVLILQKVAMFLLKQIIMLTPVDSGRARESWVQAMHNPIVNPRGSTTSGGAGKTSDTEVTANLTGSSIWIAITNKVPYILALEFGRKSFTIRPIAPGGYKENPFEFPTKRADAPPRGWLRWMVGGQAVFAREVTIPSHPGFHMVHKAMVSTKTQFTLLFAARSMLKSFEDNPGKVI